MKRNTMTNLVGLAALWLAFATQTASAFYDPAEQRWINRDPIGEKGGVNLHGFVRNTPVDEVDAFGEASSNPPINVPVQIFPEHRASADANSCLTGTMNTGNAPAANPPSSTTYPPCLKEGDIRNIGDPYPKTVECPCTGTMQQICTDFEECVKSIKVTLKGTKPVLEWVPRTCCRPKGCPEYL